MTIPPPAKAIVEPLFEVIPDARSGAPVALLTVLRGPRTCERFVRDTTGWVREVWARSAASGGRWVFRRSRRSGLSAALRVAGDGLRADLATFERRMVSDHTSDRRVRSARNARLDAVAARYALPVLPGPTTRPARRHTRGDRSE